MNGELYHASENTDIEILEPKAITFRDKNEGPVVFATPDKAYASMFLTPTDDSWTIKSGYKFNEDDEKLWITIIGDEKRFRENDKGGAIYTLPKDTFLAEPKRNSEWVSKTSVKPLKKDIYTNSLDAMIDNNVIVYFVSPEKLEEIKKISHDSSERFGVLKELESENERRGLENPVQYR